MSDSGKSTKATGHHAAEDTPHATCNKTWTAPSRSTNGEETPSSSGAPTQLVDVDYLQQTLSFEFVIWLKKQTKILLKIKNHVSISQDFDDDLDE